MGQFVKFEGVTVKRIRPIEEKVTGDKTYRTLRVDVEAALGKYDKKQNVYQFEATFDRTIKEAQELIEGQVVNFGIDIRGNEWEKKATGEIFVFNKLEIATIEVVGGAPKNEPMKTKIDEPALEADDDLPF